MVSEPLTAFRGTIIPQEDMSLKSEWEEDLRSSRGPAA